MKYNKEMWIVCEVVPYHVPGIYARIASPEFTEFTTMSDIQNKADNEGMASYVWRAKQG